MTARRATCCWVWAATLNFVLLAGTEQKEGFPTMVQNLKSRLGVQTREQHNRPPFDRLTPPHRPCREVRLVPSQARGLGGEVGSVHLEKVTTGENSGYCGMRNRRPDRQPGQMITGSLEVGGFTCFWRRQAEQHENGADTDSDEKLRRSGTKLTQRHRQSYWFFCSVFLSHSLHSFLEIRLSVSRKCLQLKSSSIVHQLHPPGMSRWDAAVCVCGELILMTWWRSCQTTWIGAAKSAAYWKQQDKMRSVWLNIHTKGC